MIIEISNKGDFAKALKELRKQCNISQKKLAVQIWVSYYTILRYEKEHTSITTDVALKAFKFFAKELKESISLSLK